MQLYFIHAKSFLQTGYTAASTSASCANREDLGGGRFSTGDEGVSGVTEGAGCFKLTDDDDTAAIQLVELEGMQEVEEMEKLEVELDKADKVEKELESRLEGLRLKVGQLEKLVGGMQV